MTALYTSGTIALVNGSPVINGIDTAWKTALIVGGTVHVEAEGNPLPILPDDSAGASEHPITDTQMTSAIKWQGATGTYKYALVRENTYTSQQAANATAVSELLRRLNNPTIAAIAGVQGEQDHLILLTGQSTATIIPRSSLIQGVEPDATVETPAGLATYESEAAGFIVLVSNAGDQRAALYFKRTATSGDWSAPAFLTGAKGDQGNIGPTGITWRGVWNGAAAYSKNDVVQNNKSAWIALRANTNVAPPVLPATGNADWELFARAGVDGTGTGDVVGPAGVTAGNLVQFADATGKLIGRASIGSPAFLGRVAAGVGDIERLSVAQVNQALGGWEPIADLNLAGQSMAIVQGLAPFFSLRFTGLMAVSPGAYAVVQASTDNGTSFLSALADYRFNNIDNTFNGTPPSSLFGGDGNIVGVLIGNDTSIISTVISAFNVPRIAYAIGTNMFDSDSARNTRLIGHRLLGAAARNAVRVQAINGSFSFGRIFVEGLRG